MAIALAASPFVSWADTTWIADPSTPGDWFDPNNWSNGLPASTNAFINNGGTTQIGGAASASSLTLGDTATDVGTVNLLSGSLQLSGSATIGNTGTGTFTQADNTQVTLSTLYLADQTGSSGTYTLNNATLTNNAIEYIGAGGNAQFNQLGGTHTVTGVLVVGVGATATGAYNLSGGQLISNRWEEIGQHGTGTFTQSGGTNTLSGIDGLYLGSSTGSGTYVLTAGTLNALNSTTHEEAVGFVGTGTFNQSGGTNSCGILFLGQNGLGSGPVPHGTYSLSGTGSLTANVADVGYTPGSFFGIGTLDISGGTANFTTALQINNSDSAVQLTGGSLTTPTITIAAGSFSQSAGTLSCTTINNSGNLCLDAPATISTVNLNAGTLSGYGTISGAVKAGSAAHSIAPSFNLSATSTGTLTMGKLTTNSFTTLSLNLVSPGTNDALKITANKGLTLNGGTIQIANAPNTASSLGYYKIIQYTGAIQGTGIASLTLPAPQNGIAYFLTTTKDPGYIDLHRGLLGDADDDGTVDLTDLTILATNWQKSGTWAQGDFDGSGFVDLTDLTILAENWQGSIASFQSALAALDLPNVSVPTPEPATALLLLPATLLLTRRRPRLSSSSS